MRKVVLESPYAARDYAKQDRANYDRQCRLTDRDTSDTPSGFEGWCQYDRDINVAYARKCLLDCLQRGEGPIASHLLIPQVLDDLKPEERALGIAAGLAWHDVADAIVFYTDRGWSRGMRYAHEYATARGLVIELRSLTGEPVSVGCS